MRENHQVLLVSGSTRAGSTNTAVLRTAVELVPPGTEAVLYDQLAELPAFNPDDDGDQPPAGVIRLRRQIADAVAVLFCTPEYAGSLPGSFKNLLDWTVGGGEMYAKPVAWVTAAAEGRGDGATETLRTVLGYLGASVIEEACIRLPVRRDGISPEGTLIDPEQRAALAGVVSDLAGPAGVPARGRPTTP